MDTIKPVKKKEKTAHQRHWEEVSIDGHGVDKVSNLQTCWNIFNATQGVGILSMPYAVSQGTFYSLIICVVVAMISNYTNKRLINCLYEKDAVTGIDMRVRGSYEEVGEAAFGTVGKWIVYAAIVVEQLSYCTILLILCGTTLENSFPETPLSIGHWALVAFILIIPNAFMMHLKQVSFLSLIAVIVGQGVYISVIAYSIKASKSWRVGELTSLQFCQVYIAVGIMTIGYSSQPYISAIEDQMKNPKQFRTLLDLTYIVVTIIKIAFGTIGYLTFKKKTKQVITNNLPHGPLRITVNFFVFLLALSSFSFPAYTVFVVVDKLIVLEGIPTIPVCMCTAGFTTEITPRGSKASVHEDLESESCKCTQKHKNDPFSVVEVLRRAGVRLILISGALTMAICVPYFGLYMSLVGNITGMCLVFIFPLLFHLKLKKLDIFNTGLHVLIICCSCFSIGAGMYSSSRALVLAYRYGLIEG